MTRSRAALLVLILLAAASGGADALTVYVRRAVILPPGTVVIADLVQPAGELPADVRDVLQHRVAELADRALVLPASLYRAELDGLEGHDLILVGKRTLVIPRGSPGDHAAPLLDRLVDRMQELGWLGRGKVEIEVERISGIGAGQSVKDAAFTVLRADRRVGPMAGEAEVGFRGTTDSGELALGSVALRLRQDDAAEAARPDAAQPGVRPNDSVWVRFRKGAVTVEMPGRATAPAQVGGEVTVFVPEARRSFSGVLEDGKAVSVEIP